MSIIGELECTFTKKAKKEKFLIKEGVHLIGRCTKRQIKGDPHYYKKLPEWTKNLIEATKYSIIIRGSGNGRENNYISRAQIWLDPGDSYARIVDLNSKNKTYVNGTKIQSDEDTYEIRYIYPEDTVSIGGGVANLKYKIRPQKTYTNHAIFVGSGEEDDLEVAKNSIDALKKEIVKRGFAGNIEALIGDEARKDGILTYLEKIGKEVREDSILLFYFVGYAKKSRSCKLRVYDGYITSKELFDALMESWCQKLFILDGPYTSGVSEYEMPPRSVLIGNKEEVGEGKIKSRDGNVLRYLTRAICKALEGRQEINVANLMEEVKKDPLIHYVRQSVAYRRNTRIALQGETSELNLFQ